MCILACAAARSVSNHECRSGGVFTECLENGKAVQYLSLCGARWNLTIRKRHVGLNNHWVLLNVASRSSIGGKCCIVHCSWHFERLALWFRASVVLVVKLTRKINHTTRLKKQLVTKDIHYMGYWAGIESESSVAFVAPSFLQLCRPTVQGT